VLRRSALFTERCDRAFAFPTEERLFLGLTRVPFLAGELFVLRPEFFFMIENAGGQFFQTASSTPFTLAS
jgi:hypothetical protein